MWRTSFGSRAVLFASVFGLAGCSTTISNYEKPTVAMPSAYSSAETLMSGARTGSGALPWWSRFESAELDRLVSLGQTRNSELRIATIQLAQARIRAEQVRAGTGPLVLAPLRIIAQGGGGTVDTQQSSQIGLQGSYRLDIWGEQSATVENADQQVWRVAYERDNMHRNMVGGIVSTYIAYLVAGDSLQLAREGEAVARELLQAVEKRMTLGDATQDELEQQNAALALQQAAVASLHNQREDIKSILSRLTGGLVADLNLTGEGLDSLVEPSVQTGMPSTLLLQRPDIRVVEARMRSANANIEVARARLLPPLDLSVQVGYSGLALAQIFQPQSLFWNAASSLALTIFDGGRREADKLLAESAYEEMVETYRQTIYQALREVESALVSITTTRQKLAAQQRNARAMLSMFRVASDAYALGAADVSSLHQARRNYQRSADDLVRTKAELLRAHASLALALGTDSDMATPAGR